MFGKILGKNKEETNTKTSYNEIVNKISKMNLTDMRLYVNNKLTSFEISEDGLYEVMRRLVSKDDNNRRFIESDAMESKIKKAFDLVIIISKSKKINVKTTELIQQFIELYKDILHKYDTDNKEIYTSRLNDALANAIIMVNGKTDYKLKMKVLDR